MVKEFWKIPRIWDGDPCVIIGGGPSVAGFDTGKLKGFRVIAVNVAYLLSKDFDAMFYGDRYWYMQYGEKLREFPGLKITNCEADLGKPGILVLKRDYKPGISKDPAVLNWHDSSGATAIDLAAQLGAGKIILLGFDMRPSGGKDNYHDLYPELNRHPYSKFLAVFPPIAADLRGMDIECVNATPFVDGQPLSMLDVFPRLPIDEALKC